MQYHFRKCHFIKFGKENVLMQQPQLEGNLQFRVQFNYQMHTHPHTLTLNAILYISLGFQQPALLQILDLRPDPPSSLQLVLYDGIVYTGAHYDYSNRIKHPRTLTNPSPHSPLPFEDNNPTISQTKLPKPFDIVRVHAVLLSKNQPLYIKQLEIVQSGLYEILGRQIITLEEYMKRRRFVPKVEIDIDDEKVEQLNKPSKRFKSNEEQDIQIDQRIYFQKETIEHRSFQIESNQQNSNTIPNPLQNKPNSEIVEEIIMIDTQQPMVVDNHQPFVENGQFVLQTQPTLRREAPIAIQTQQINGLTTQQSMVIETQQPIGRESQKQMQPQPMVIQHQTKVIETQAAENKPTVSRNQVQNIVKQQQDIKPKIPIRSQNIISLLLQQEDQIQIIQPPKTQKQKNRAANLINLNSNPIPPPSNIPKNPTPPPTPTHNKQTLDTQPSMMIKQLYERMHRFRILCRINHLAHFTSQKGKPCTKMLLIDQKGDEIACFLLQRATQRQSSGKLTLLKGRTYLFQNGQVQKDEHGALTITLPWSGIHQTKTLLPSFHPNKIIRAGQIESISSTQFLEKPNNSNSNSNSINNRKISKEITICGVFAGLREEPKLINNQFKVAGTLCDPEQQKSINFSMFVQELSTFPTEGAVLSLHNFKIAQHEGTYKLQSISKRSYYLVQNNNPHPYFSDLKQSSSKQTWKLLLFKNLSEINYLPRTIAALKDLLSKMIQHDHCYSEIDCNIASLQQKREFLACAVCRKQTKPERGSKTYCFHCKRIQNWTKRFILTSEIADSTGSIDVTLYSQDLPAFIYLPAQDYAQMTKQDRNAHLELSTYQNVLLKIKSQRIVGGSTHYVNKAEGAHHKRALMQIKDKTIEKRTSYQPPW